MTRKGAPVGAGLILLLGLLEAFGPLSMDLYMPALPNLATALDSSDTLAQVTMSVCMIGFAVGQLVAGPMSDRFGRRGPLLGGIIVFAIFSALSAIAPTIEWLIAFRFIQGVGGAAGMVITLAIARDLFTGVQLAKMLSWLALVGATAPIVAPVLGGQLVRFMDWRGIFWVLTGIGIALLLAAFLWLPESHPIHSRSAGGIRTLAADGRVLLRPGRYRSVLIIAGVSGIAFFSYLSMSSFVLQNEFGITPQMFGVMFAIGSLFNVAGSQTNRILVSKFTPEKMYVLGLFISCAGGVIAGVSAVANLGMTPFIVGLALYLLSTGFTLPNSHAIALTQHGERAGSAAALLGMVALIVGPIVAPLASLGGISAVTLGVNILFTTVFILAYGLYAFRGGTQQDTSSTGLV